MRLLPLCLFSAFFWTACADSSAAPDADVFSDQSARATRRAESFVRAQLSGAWSDRWQAATQIVLDTPIPLYYGEERIGAWEVPVRCDFAPCGFVTVSLEPGQHPIPEYFDQGESPAEAFAESVGIDPSLLRDGRQVRALRFSPLARFLEWRGETPPAGDDSLGWDQSTDGRWYSSIDGSPVEPEALVDALHDHESVDFKLDPEEATEIADLQASLDDQDQASLGLIYGAPTRGELVERIDGEAAPPTTSNTIARYPPYYWQIYGWGVSSSCPSGCAPIAWTMLWGWWDYSATYNNLIGGGSWYNYMSTDGSNVTRSTDSKVVGDVANTAYYIGTLMGTSCGSTSTSRIIDGQSYPGVRGYSFTVTDLGNSYTDIRNEIDAVHPLLLAVVFASDKYGAGLSGAGHAMTAYAYIYGGTSTSRYVDANTGWYSTRQMRIVWNSTDFTYRNSWKVKP